MKSQTIDFPIFRPPPTLYVLSFFLFSLPCLVPPQRICFMISITFLDSLRSVYSYEFIQRFLFLRLGEEREENHNKYLIMCYVNISHFPPPVVASSLFPSVSSVVYCFSVNNSMEKCGADKNCNSGCRRRRRLKCHLFASISWHY